MKKSTIQKFIQYYEKGSEGDIELAQFISRNWKNYQKWSNERGGEAL